MCPLPLGSSRAHAFTLLLIAVFSIAVLVEALGFIVWFIDSFAALKHYSGVTGYLFSVARIELAIFYLAYALVVWLVLLLMVSPIVERAMFLGWRRSSLISAVNQRRVQLESTALVAGLAFASILAALVTYLPYAYSQYPVGIDTHWYYEHLDALAKGVQPSRLLTEEPRAAYLLLLGMIRSATQLPARDTVMLGSMMISVLFVCGSFLLVREVGQGDLASLLAALFAGLSSQTLVATLASIFPNWLAMAEMLFFFTFLLRSVKTRSKAALVASFAISLVILVTHPWTWPIMVLILAVYAMISALQNRSWDSVRRSAGLRILAACLLVGLVIFVAASGLPVFQEIMNLGYSWVFSENLRLSRTPFMFLRDMQIALVNYSTQGLYSNWVLLALSIVGVLGLARNQKESRALLASWILVPSFLILLLGPEIQWRLLFLIPYNVLAAVGAIAISSALGRLAAGADRSESRAIAVLQALFIVFLVLLFVNNAVRSMVFISTQVVA